MAVKQNRICIIVKCELHLSDKLKNTICSSVVKDYESFSFCGLHSAIGMFVTYYNIL